MAGFPQENHRKVHGDDSDDEIDFPFNVKLQSTYAQTDYRVNETIKLIGGTLWNKEVYGSTDSLSRVGVILTLYKK
jgi:hypothetical protein